MAPILEMRGICKSFGPVNVLDGVNLVLRRGEVLGLIGENGAGKSTLIKILCGVHQMDRGGILLDGVPTVVRDAAHAQRLGISAIYQELSLIPDLNAAQNIFLNREAAFGRGLAVPLREAGMRAAARKVLNGDLNAAIDIDAPLRRLPLAQKQLVEIARTIHADAKIIIMDEPTAALEAPERQQLFRVIRRLRDQGRSIIFISHHLDEILQVCDRVNILRDGNKVADGPVADFTIDDIIAGMVGKSLEAQYPKTDAPVGGILLRVDSLGKKKAFRAISFELRQGEAIGIVGLEGCGKNELIRAVFGIGGYDAGSIEVKGSLRSVGSVREAMRQGLAFVPGERKTEGLFLLQDVAWNVTVAALRKILRWGSISGDREKAFCQGYIDRLGIRTKGPRQRITHLSGGNQQKVMLSRWMMTDADVFLLEEPTRGIDVNAKTEVYLAIGECLKRGKGMIIVSSEEEEIINICDRIIVMRNGEPTAYLDARDATVEMVKQYSVKNG
jgi:ribose transport system ATP-binding protein